MNRRCSAVAAAVLLLALTGCGESKAPFSTNKEPIQEDYHGSETFALTLSQGAAVAYPVATYRLAGVVMSKREYTHGWGAEIAPFDLAVVWGRLSHPEIRKLLSVHHDSTRLAWFRIKGDDPPVTPEYLLSHGSNNHLIPATASLKTALRRNVGNTDKVVVEGYLVNVEGTFEGRPIALKTSLERTDTDRGACEIIYVTKLQVGDETYR